MYINSTHFNNNIYLFCFSVSPMVNIFFEDVILEPSGNVAVRGPRTSALLVASGKMFCTVGLYPVWPPGYGLLLLGV